MLVNVNKIAKRGYKLSDCVLYKGSRYKIVAIDFSLHEDDSMFLLNGYNSKCLNINFEEDALSSFVLYDSDETLTRKYSLWVSYNQISKVEDEVKHDNKKYEYNPSDFVNIDDKKSIKKLLKIKEDMSCDGLVCSTCPLYTTDGDCALYFGEHDAKERFDAIIEMYKNYHLRRNNE